MKNIIETYGKTRYNEIVNNKKQKKTTRKNDNTL